MISVFALIIVSMQSPALQPAKVIVRPYLQLGNRATDLHSVALAWHTNDADGTYRVDLSQGSKQWSAKPIYRRVSVEPLEPHRVYTATIRGMEPGKPVSYSLISGQRRLVQGSFNAPATSRFLSSCLATVAPAPRSRRRLRIMRPIQSLTSL